MANKIGKMAEFTQDEGFEQDENEPEVKEDEKDTQSGSSPDEKPEQESTSTEEETSEDKDLDETPEEEETPLADAGEEDDEKEQLITQNEGLKEEKEKLMQQIKLLRSTKRDIKGEELEPISKEEVGEVQKEVADDLKGIHPDDVATIEKVVRARGYIKKDELPNQDAKILQDLAVNQFLDKHPEYKPENDPDNIRWDALKTQLATFYRMPEDMGMMVSVMEKAHKDISPNSAGGEKTEVKRERLKTAGLGSGSSKAPSSDHSSGDILTDSQVEELRRGGFTEKEIKKMMSS